jgi:hypothetical protein
MSDQLSNNNSAFFVSDNSNGTLGSMTTDGDIIDTHITISTLNSFGNETNIDSQYNHTNSDSIQPQLINITVEALNNAGVNIGISDYGFPMVTYHSALKNHSITLELDIGNRQALINDLDIQFSFPGELTLLLKKVEYELKKIHITTILQHVMFDDWIKILRPQNIFELQYHNKEQGFAKVMCRTDKFAEAIMKGLGV